MEGGKWVSDEVRRGTRTRIRCSKGREERAGREKGGSISGTSEGPATGEAPGSLCVQLYVDSLE